MGIFKKNKHNLHLGLLSHHIVWNFLWFRGCPAPKWLAHPTAIGWAPFFLLLIRSYASIKDIMYNKWKPSTCCLPLLLDLTNSLWTDTNFLTSKKWESLKRSMSISTFSVRKFSCANRLPRSAVWGLGNLLCKMKEGNMSSMDFFKRYFSIPFFENKPDGMRSKNEFNALSAVGSKTLMPWSCDRMDQWVDAKACKRSNAIFLNDEMSRWRLQPCSKILFKPCRVRYFFNTRSCRTENCQFFCLEKYLPGSDCFKKKMSLCRASNLIFFLPRKEME